MDLWYYPLVNRQLLRSNMSSCTSDITNRELEVYKLRIRVKIQETRSKSTFSCVLFDKFYFIILYFNIKNASDERIRLLLYERDIRYIGRFAGIRKLLLVQIQFRRKQFRFGYPFDFYSSSYFKDTTNISPARTVSEETVAFRNTSWNFATGIQAGCLSSYLFFSFHVSLYFSKFTWSQFL